MSIRGLRRDATIVLGQFPRPRPSGVGGKAQAVRALIAVEASVFDANKTTWDIRRARAEPVVPPLVVHVAPASQAAARSHGFLQPPQRLIHGHLPIFSEWKLVIQAGDFTVAIDSASGLWGVDHVDLIRAGHEPVEIKHGGIRGVKAVIHAFDLEDDYGGGAKYSIFENNVACARWLRETWAASLAA